MFVKVDRCGRLQSAVSKNTVSKIMPVRPEGRSKKSMKRGDSFW
jgi:hypothetical protein